MGDQKFLPWDEDLPVYLNTGEAEVCEGTATENAHLI